LVPRGKLYLVGTPIGNLGDLSRRAEEVLRDVDCIGAEDTRRTKVLLDHIGCRTPMISFHARNERRRVPEIVRRLEAGESVAIVSDAGNPGISDPAEKLVREAVENGIHVVPVPGPSAFVAALIASGLPARRFRFEGYLPSREGPRKERLRSLRSEEATLIFYESPRRVGRMMEEVEELLGDRPLVLAREITKKFEEFFRGSASAAREHIDANPPRGEFVVVVGGAEGEEALPAERMIALVSEEVGAGSSLRDAVRVAARVGLWKEQDLYRLLREKGKR
jgi:16S rRNA (cytidine1402-2'-O)-methyltransferase